MYQYQIGEKFKISSVYFFKYSLHTSKLKLSGATAHEGQGLLCQSQYAWPFGAEVHEQMSRSGGLSGARPPVSKSPSKLGTHLSTHCSRDEKLSRPYPARE
ncbi:uncharacterized protein TNCV_3000151 [Trichonephila clavipes]|nr:uncharacterized protein TNCV_3000151 [Trichonephila clavipes]